MFVPIGPFFSTGSGGSHEGQLLHGAPLAGFASSICSVCPMIFAMSTLPVCRLACGIQTRGLINSLSNQLGGAVLTAHGVSVTEC
jgi:hypothetical protein